MVLDNASYLKVGNCFDQLVSIGKGSQKIGNREEGF